MPFQSIESNSENGLHELCVVSNASAPKDVSADDWVQRLSQVQEILQVCALGAVCKARGRYHGDNADGGYLCVR